MMLIAATIPSRFKSDLPIEKLPDHIDEVLVLDVAGVVDRYFTAKNAGS